MQRCVPGGRAAQRTSLTGASPHSFFSSGFAPCSRSHRTIASWPARAASKMGVLPCQCALVTTSGPNSFSTASASARLPSVHARRNLASLSSSSG